MERLPKYIHEEQGTLWLTEDERDNLKISYRLKNILFQEQSAFQHVMIVDSYDFGRMLVLDGVVQTTAMDGHIYNEMISHVPLTLHPDPQHVLIIGGGDCGVAVEAAKYAQVKRIDMVEIDEAVVRASMEHLPEVSGGLNDPRVRFIYDDGVAFAKQQEAAYDVIIVDSSDPIGPAVQLFSSDFYDSLHRALKPNGMMVCQSQSPVFHADVMAQTYERIERIFPHPSLYTAVVPTYPGGLWSFTIGSKASLPNLEHIRFDKETTYVNEHIVKRCFHLPQFMLEQLDKQPVL